MVRFKFVIACMFCLRCVMHVLEACFDESCVLTNPIFCVFFASNPNIFDFQFHWGV